MQIYAFLSSSRVFCGTYVRDILNSMHESDQNRQDFESNMLSSYMACAQYLQKRLPLRNKALRAFKSLSPAFRGKDDSLDLMKSLKDIVPIYLSMGDRIKYDQEAHRFHSSPSETFRSP